MKNNPSEINIKELLQEEAYTGKFIVGLRRALLSQWQRDGFIRDRRDNHETWARFSLLEILWLEIIQELRAFGLKSEAIQTVGEYAFAKAEQKLLNATTEILSEDTSYVLKVQKNGVSNIKKQVDANQIFQEQKPENHIVIYLNDMVSRSIRWLFNQPNTEWSQGLTRDEVQAVLILMNQKYDSFKCKGKSNTESNENAAQVAELIQHRDYRRLEIILDDKSIFSVARKTKAS
ncbi:hypothetical protein JCM19297_227 [Nonlabens ulvanivorans]|jgi:hypothetical protein|nr:MerR family transcriptional regulator [Nonlabens ulvanivorans]GAK90928.1 hypothetical protein JCM19297_227 [Nonlabens ulvanivorans]